MRFLQGDRLRHALAQYGSNLNLLLPFCFHAELRWPKAQRGRRMVVRGGRLIRQLLWFIDRPGQPQISLPSLAGYYYLKLRKKARQDATSSLFIA
jgi:hypothetical protein